MLLIADEVMTGAWRTGGFLASADEGVVPDLVALGKGLAGGYSPLAGVLVSDRVAGAIERGSGVFAHGHTHGFNPLSARVGVEVLRRAIDLGVPANVVERGAQLHAGLDELARSHHVIGDVRGRGLLWGLDLVADRTTRAPLFGAPAGSGRVVAAARQAGLLLYPAGVGETTVVLIAPPLTVTADEIVELLDLLERVLSTLVV